MSRPNDLQQLINRQPIFCNNLGFGEQGAILSKLDTAIFLCPNIEKSNDISAQLSALGKENVVINDFDKPFTLSKFSSSDNKYDLINALFKISTSNIILISTPRMLFSFLPDIEQFKNSIIEIKKNDDIDIVELEKRLVQLGYKKSETVTYKGEFSRRGDVFDIFNVVDDNPTRLDFFDTNVDDIYKFDFLTFEHTEKLKKIKIAPNKLNFFSSSEIITKLNKFKLDNNIFFDLINAIERSEDVPLEFLYPFSNSINTIAEIDYPIIISNEIEFENIYSEFEKTFLEKINLIFKKENIIKIYENNQKILKLSDFFNKYLNKLIFFDNYDLNNTDLKNKLNSKNIISINYNTKNLPSFLYNLESLQLELNKFKDKQIYLCLSNTDTLNSIKKIFTERNIPFSTNKNSKGIILTELNIPYNICFSDEEKFYIGSTNFAHKKTPIKRANKSIKYLPKAGEYVVHSTYGIGKCEGIVNMQVSGVDKEFFKIIYRGNDTLYVPYENADLLSLYMTEGASVTLNKLGGKEFYNEKLKAIKSIEDMSKDLLELYAKRKSTKGFKYSEDDYLYTEFENAFEYTETADQLQAIADVKNDMCSGKVMDRLICGDVGFGKTEVAMRALFKAVENNKQVAILAPTTILSLQHYNTAIKRTKNFGVSVEMLNRFRSSKEQKKILEDLSSGKLNVICGTHRLLSKDVKFNDLGLLILDEEQRFGVKAKEQIKQMKTNVDVLTLSATPIPRTLSMTLMTIRDISIINTPPVNRLPVKTYVMTYNEEVIVNAIQDELARDGQTLIVYNNIEKIYTLSNRLESLVNNEKAHFDVAHGQMSEIALENAIKRLYDKETNVFVSTTLIENGIDLPRANTLIVIESDKLGLSQMYQLRGRVGRNDEQAYAYFTYDKEKPLTIEASNRLQAIAENTDLGSGFKIAMRDMQIRGAGELLGKVQHGHMLKIGYDTYARLLSETIKRLKGEKVETSREVKLDIAITSKIPYSFISDEAERLKIIAKISNIIDKTSAKTILNELAINYGKLPKEIYNLTNLAIVKAYAKKNDVKTITITKNNMKIVYYEDIDIKKLMAKMNKFSHFKFENTALPTISLNPQYFSVQTAVNYIIEYLNS